MFVVEIYLSVPFNFSFFGNNSFWIASCSHCISAFGFTGSHFAVSAYFIFVQQLLPVCKNTRFALLFFVFAVFFNELILTLQGLSGYIKFPLSNVNELLLTAAILLLISSGCLAFSVFKTKQLPIKK